MKSILLLSSLLAFVFNSDAQLNPSTATIPISIDYKNGYSGTGFILADSPYVYIVTAKHMIFKTDKSGKRFTTNLIGDEFTITTYFRKLSSERINTVDVDIKGIFQSNCIVNDTTNDIVAILIGKNNPAGTLVNYSSFVGKNHQTKGITLVSSKDVGSFDDVEIGNDIYVFGYPKSIGLGLGQFELNKPLLCRGIIAGENNVNRTLILNAQVYHGNSGGPVFCLIRKTNEYQIIGVVSELIPYESQVFKNGQLIDSTGVLSNSNYSIVTPLDILLPLLNKFQSTLVYKD
ncbi:MAG TPA: trypsin-like peptidase domain-containing protein [Puia sp.]|jgi:hypothetical protein|nr:trypsin-like peptidase domain-containing protein [Puia sp.]